MSTDDAVTIVFLVRHGQAAVPDQDGRYFSKVPQSPLTEAGRSQAAGARRLLEQVRIDAVVSSDLLRARQTAEIISAGVGVAVEHDERLREVDTGDLDGSTVEDLRRAYPDFLPWIQAGFRQQFAAGAGHLDPSLCFPAGESVSEAGLRAVAGFQDICERHRGRCVVVVGHAWVNSTILCHVLGIPDEHYFRFGQANGGVSLVRVGEGGRGMLDGHNLAVPLDIVAGGSLPVHDQVSVTPPTALPQGGR
jgi:broad specificity phosphatase PhoE